MKKNKAPTNYFFSDGKTKLVYGIQQIGIGVDNAYDAFKWYATLLGADIPVFDDDTVNTFMAPYMGGEPHKKRAIFALNLQGGSGFELWQYLDRAPLKSVNGFSTGDLGINFIKVKSKDIEGSYKRLQDQKVRIISGIVQDVDGRKCFYIQDPCDNILQIKENDAWYIFRKFDTGGIFGCTIGVSDIGRSLQLYRDILGYSVIIYDKSGVFEDLKSLPNGGAKFRRVLLTHPNDRTGGFSKLLGRSQVELIQSLDQPSGKILQDRFWGDIGFIHVCFDIYNMEAMIKECVEAGMPFKVISNDFFNMDKANGRFGYIEDPDGTLIEFVETYKVPLIKKINWGINLLNRDPNKPLPNWLIRALSLNRIKFKKRKSP